MQQLTNWKQIPKSGYLFVDALKGKYGRFSIDEIKENGRVAIVNITSDEKIWGKGGKYTITEDLDFRNIKWYYIGENLDNIPAEVKIRFLVGDGND